jgi:hypothetical protein
MPASFGIKCDADMHPGGGGLPLVSVLAGLAAAEDRTNPGGVRATLELNRDFYYAGDPMPIRISVTNDGRAVSNPVKTPLVRGSPSYRRQHSAADGNVDRSGTGPARQAAAQAFFGTVELTELCRSKPAGGLRDPLGRRGESNTLKVKLIPS